MDAAALLRRLDAVRRSWRRAHLIAALATFVAEACVVVLALALVDRAYHLEAGWRIALLVATILVLAVSAIALSAPLRRRLADERVALHIEERIPELSGKLAAAVEAVREPGVDPLRAELAAALALDCLERTARVHPWTLVDRRRLGRRAAAGALALLAVGATVAVRPGLAAHELARLFMPWLRLPLDEAETRAASRKAEIQRANAELLAAQAAARTPPAPTLTVEPGDARVRRGSSLRVRVGADRVTEPPTLLLRDSAGAWRTLAMSDDSEHPGAYAVDVHDIGVDGAYAATMGTVRTRDYAISVYDAAELQRATVTLSYPAYLHTPDRVMPAGPIVAVEGTVARVELEASAPLRSGQLAATGMKDAALAIDGAKATGTFAVAASGQWRLAATDANGETVAGIDGPWAITARKDAPPTLELLYPQIDTVAHPLAEIAIAARAEDDVALKEVRLRWTWCEDQPIVVRRACAGATSRLAEFIIALEDRPSVHEGDSIIFTVEAEDMKGQVAASDPYSITVGKLESVAHYGPQPHAVHEHPPAPVELITLIGAVNDLEARKSTMSPEQFQRESQRLATFLLEKK